MDTQNLQDKIDEVIKILNVSFNELQGLDKKRLEIEKYEHEVREMEKGLLLREKKTQDRENETDEERERLNNKSQELLELERKLDKSRIQIIAVKEQIGILDKKMEALKIEEAVLEEKKEEIKKLKPLQDELTHREAMIKKEAEIDRVRKEHLDIREERIRRREQQLQMEATI